MSGGPGAGARGDARRRRVLVVSNLYPPVVRGGYEVECRDVVEHLRRDHDVDVLTSDHLLRRTGPESGVHRLLPFSDDTRLNVLRAPYRSMRATRVVRRFLAERRPDLVFVWNGAGVPHLVFDELHRTDLPIAYRVCEAWFGGLFRDDLLLRFLRPQTRTVDVVWSAVVRAACRWWPSLRRASVPPREVGVLWNSEYLRRAVGAPAGVIAVEEAVQPPITASADVLATVPRAPSACPSVLVVGRIERLKGIDVVVRAIGVLGRRHDLEVSLTIVGGGEDAVAQKLRALARDEGVAERVTFTGPLRGAALHERIAAAHVWAVPSLSGESAPMVSVEAGLARVPLVASRVGGLPELLREPDEALLFEPGDVAGCAEAIQETLTDPAEAGRRVARAHARARELMWDPYVQRVEAFLDRVASVEAGRAVQS